MKRYANFMDSPSFYLNTEIKNLPCVKTDNIYKYVTDRSTLTS